MKRNTMAAAVAIALAASAVSLTAPAIASSTNPYDTDEATGAPTGSIVGVGSDTTQIVMHGVAAAWNASNTPHLSTFAADGLPAQIKLLTTSAAAINRPNGSGAGKNLLHGATNNPEVNFARSSSSLSASENTDGLKQAAFAVDGLKMAVADTSNAPATLTKAQITGIYNGTFNSWDDVGGTSTALIEPKIPQSGSGTRSFFQGQIGVSDAQLGGSVGTTQEHSITDIQGNPNAIGPMSTARMNEATDPTKFVGGTASWTRAVYNVIRGADQANADLNAIFGPTGFLCSNSGRTAIKAAGFEPIADQSQGGPCGAWTSAAVTDLKTFDQAAAPTTTTTLTGSAVNTSTVTLSATVAGNNTEGTVTFKEGANAVGDPVEVVAGKATLNVPNVSLGSHDYTASFTPTDLELAQPSTSDTATVVVKKITAVTLVMTPSTQQYFARSSTATATVLADGAPATGSVQFLRSGTLLGTVALSNGVASQTLPLTTKVGTYTITAQYLGTDDTNAASAATSFKILRAPSTTTGRLAIAKIHSTQTGKVISQVKIKGGAAGIYPTGSVRVYEGTKALTKPKALVKGKATITLPRVAVGAHKLRVKYLGSTNVAPSYSSKFTLTVVR